MRSPNLNIERWSTHKSDEVWRVPKMLVKNEFDWRVPYTVRQCNMQTVASIIQCSIGCPSSQSSYIKTMKTYLINKEVPEMVYNAVSDYVYNEGNRVPVEISGDLVDLDISDIYLEDGDVFVPVGYRRIYKGSNNTDDRDEYEAVYDAEPTLTKEQVDQMVHEYPM